jgi:hypothetical protein
MPTSVRERRRPTIYVSIVSSNPETLDGFQSYLGAAGVPSHCARMIQNVRSVAPDRATAIVIFPDDFPEDDVFALMRHLRVARPSLLPLLVTSEPQRFRNVLEEDGRRLRPIVFPKPAFGWDILDAIRDHAETDQRSK